MRRRYLVTLVAFAMVFVGFPGASSPTLAASPGVVISQVYGGGGNSGGVFTNDFVELFNRGTSAVSLSGWSLQYTSATGTGTFGSATNLITPLTGTLAPGQYLLIQEAAGTASIATLPTPDVIDTTPINMSGTGGKIALVSTTAPLGCNGSTSSPCSPSALATIVDLVGWDGANFFEGAAAAPATTNATGALRKSAGCVDTDNNGADFIASAPTPRNTSSPLHFCVTETAPSVASTAPANGDANIATDASISVTFSESVNTTGTWATLACATSGSHSATVSGGPITFTLDPDTDFALDETCTVTVLASGVTDQDALDPPDAMDTNYAFSFSTLAPATPIHDVQGSGHISPYAGMLVKNVSGVVTGKRSNGFYMQDPDADADPATSEAIFVFTSGAPTVSVGDAVHVRGTVQEFRPGGASTANLTTTELTLTSVTKYSSGNALPAAIVIGTDRTPPTEVIEDDASSGDVETSGVFDPATDGIDFWESLEAMRVEIPDPVIVGPSNNFNEISVLANDGAGATGRTARGGIKISASDKNPEKIIVDDEILKLTSPSLFPQQLSVGDHFAGSVVGVVDYNFGNFMVEATQAPTATYGGLAREVTAEAGAYELTIATFNVENLDPGDHTFATMASLIVNNLRSPDLLSLEEIQDNNGEADTGVVDATTTLTMLRDAIVAAGGPTYAWSEIDPVNDADGGAPGGNIRQVFFYRTDRGLAFVSRPGAGSTTANAVTNVGGEPQLQYSPGRIDPTNAAFTTSRKPLAGEFTYRGHHLFVIANHWNSKGGDDPLWGHRQPPVLSSEVQRLQQAAVVADFVGDILAIDANADVVVLGDLNDFEFSAPVTTLKNAGLHDLIETLPVNERYTYVFEGNSQTLDHILTSASLLPVATDDVVHVNSEFWDQASDHEPQIVRLFLPDLNALCSATQAVVSDAGIASSLCAKLNAAKASRARGDEESFAGQLGAFVNELEAQRGKAITDADASRLEAAVALL